MTEESGYKLRARVTKGSDHQLLLIRDVGEAELADIDAAVHSLRQFRRRVSPFEMLFNNGRELRRYAVWTNGTTDGKANLAQVPLEHVAFEYNRLLLNYLASCRLFLDFTTHELEQIGKASATSLFRDATAHAYDSSFAYRLLDQLRNYAQHRGLPVASVVFANHEGKPATCEVALSRDELLADAKMKKSVRDELKSQPELIPLPELVSEYQKLIEGIDACALAAFIPEHQAAYKRIEALWLEVHAVNGEASPCIAAFETKSNGTQAMLEVPLEAAAMQTYQAAARMLDRFD